MAKGKGFDSSLDQQLHHIADLDSAAPNIQIRLTVQSYNDGPPKIGMIRTGEKKDGERFYRGIGRLTVAELVDVLTALRKFTARLEKVGVITEGAVSAKRFARWLGKHGKPLAEDEAPRKPRDQDEDDEPDEKPAKKKRQVEDEDDEPDEKPAKRKLKRSLPQR